VYGGGVRSQQSRSVKSTSPNIPLPSQYLHVSDADDLPRPQPPLAVFSNKPALNRAKLEHSYSVERRISPLSPELGATSLELTGDHCYVNDGASRLPSRSADNLSEYVGMSGDSARRSADSRRADNAGLYSYARNFDLEPLLNGLLTPSPPADQHGASSIRLKKTSSSPTVLDDATSSPSHTAGVSVKSGSAVASRLSDEGSDVVKSGSAVASRLSDEGSDVTDGGTQSAVSSPVVSPAAGISMSTRSRVFTRQK